MTSVISSSASPSSRFVGLLLAAGKGSRFDPSGADNKLLAPLSDTDDCVVAAAARKLLAALPVVAVVNSLQGEVARRLAAMGCQVVECRDAGEGMSASLMCGIRHTKDATGWLIALGDMPHVQTSTHGGLLAALKDGVDLAVPVYLGKRGNPVAFGRKHLDGLLQLSGDRGARELLKSSPVNEIPVNDPGIHRDIDTRADLAASGSTA
ncbi:molybdopterin-guanine dinucleotide biosynthesis protein MobA [Herbaspirillum sp. meg3]|uniref:nucleotidyltransferase family protein n=1 Tax=Herbaspirillum sp. meg3 TaxID=2025949 RepID=UPI000B99D379|nr:nucleotidyltransferase family protein [Herbaspirillum sp. meg3]ASU39049.1 molybdopterin-guanine dinucleotide biosynthesis protein MobA [Herbaspirillum sp. meg3]